MRHWGPLDVAPKPEPVLEAFSPPPSWMRGTQSGLRNECDPFLCFSSSARVILQLLFHNSEEKDFFEENPMLQEHQLHLLLQKPSDVSDVSSSVPNSLLQRTETGTPGIRIADARWRCSTRLRVFFVFNKPLSLPKPSVQNQEWTPGRAPVLPQRHGFLKAPRRQVLYFNILCPELKSSRHYCVMV